MLYHFQSKFFSTRPNKAVPSERCVVKLMVLIKHAMHFSAPQCEWTTCVWIMALVLLPCHARWVWYWSLGPCYLGEFSQSYYWITFHLPAHLQRDRSAHMHAFAGCVTASPYPRCLWTGLGTPAGIRIHFTVLLFPSPFLPEGCWRVSI